MEKNFRNRKIKQESKQKSGPAKRQTFVKGVSSKKERGEYRCLFELIPDAICPVTKISPVLIKRTDQ